MTFLLKSWHILLLTVSLTITICRCVEEDQPELFLPPRNFNPHPYQAGYEPGSRRSGNNGPVLFPETPPEPSANAYIAGSAETGTEHPIDKHPYASLAKKRKYKLAGRFQDNQADSVVHKALAAHAAKILKIPPSQLKESHASAGFSGEHDDYEFSYKVLDYQGGGDHSHTQSQNGRATNGEYRVKLPDGRVQIVSYTADKNGYNAEVKYAQDTSANQYSSNQDDSRNAQNKLDDRHKYEYYYDPAQSDAALNYDEYATVYINSDGEPYDLRSYYVKGENVQVLNGRTEDRIGAYVGSTAVPFAQNTLGNYIGTVSSTATSYLDN